MNLVGDLGIWVAVVSAAWTAGALLARWRGGGVGGSAAAGYAMLTTAAMLVLAWGLLAGAMLRQDPALAIVHESLPFAAGPVHRMAAVWSTLRGALLTLAALLSLGGLVLAADDSHLGSTAATRLGGLVAAMVVLVLLVAALVAPPFAPASAARDPSTVALFLLHPAAALAPLFALGAIAAILMLACNAVSMYGVTSAEVADQGLRRSALAGWILATLALGAEQVARARLGITARDAVVLGSSASAIVLWLVLGVLTHARARRLVLGVGAGRGPGARASAPWHVHVTHLGALLLVAGFALHIVAARSSVRVVPGEPAVALDVFGREWRLVNQGLSRFDADGHEVAAIAIELTPPGGSPRLVSSELRQYYSARTGMPMGRAMGVRAVQRGAWQELRLVLDDAVEGDTAMVRVSFVPLALLWHAGVALLLVGGIVTLIVAPPLPNHAMDDTE